MEAFYEITVTDFPAIVAVADGEVSFQIREGYMIPCGK